MTGGEVNDNQIFLALWIIKVRLYRIFAAYTFDIYYILPELLQEVCLSFRAKLTRRDVSFNIYLKKSVVCVTFIHKRYKDCALHPKSIACRSIQFYLIKSLHRKLFSIRDGFQLNIYVILIRKLSVLSFWWFEPCVRYLPLAIAGASKYQKNNILTLRVPNSLRKHITTVASTDIVKEWLLSTRIERLSTRYGFHLESIRRKCMLAIKHNFFFAPLKHLFRRILR